MSKQSRRKFFGGLFGTFGLGILGAWIFRRPILNKLFFEGNFDTDLLSLAPAAIDEMCILTSKQAEGPFFFPSPERKDITEGKNGQSLNLKLQILNHPDCTPITGAIVEIWHCDAEGVYSGYPEEVSRDVWKTFMLIAKNGKKNNDEIHVDPINKTRFLRGRQRSNSAGWVEFGTIFPGWYVGRVPHIHAKVFLDGDKEMTTQFYFDTDLCNEIYTTQSPYDKYGKCPMELSEDVVLASNKVADGLLLKVSPAGADASTLEAIGKLGIA
jgi:protocatechuate 3,4-dioxygenase beta subunit